MENSRNLNIGRLLSGCLPGYEDRPEQELMAEAVYDALKSNSVLLVEAATGVGKSLAYLIAAMSWLIESDDPFEMKRIVVSTQTKALQRQLCDKDIPFLQKHFFPTIRYALSVGSENYLCLRRLQQGREFGLFEVDDRAFLTEVFKWRRTTKTGLRSEINVPQHVWSKISREADLCYGRKCKHYKECFYQTAKTYERQASVLVTNHHLFFANVAAGFNVLPHFDAVIFDEAHELEDVAADYLGIEVSSAKLKHLFDTILNERGKGLLTRLKGIKSSLIDSALTNIDYARAQSDAFFLSMAQLTGSENQSRMRQANAVQNQLSEPLVAIENLLDELEKAYADDENLREIQVIKQRCKAQRLNLDTILSQSMEETVYWGETSKRNIKLHATPINIASILRELVFNKTSASVLTSATLSAQGKFTYVKNALGIDKPRELLLQSPFDYDRQCIMYIAAQMPIPGEDQYNGELSNTISSVLSTINTKTMVLFTSYAVMNDVAQKVETTFKILKQGDMDNYQIIESFKSSNDTVLFGTYTFWQGVDFPGEQLQCVIIAKLPFGVPTDPILEGRVELLTNKGVDPFNEYMLPRAVITLRQGFGRLIRTKTDYGAVVILDSRIMKKPYGQVFLDSLPKVKVTSKLEDVQRFFSKRSKKML